MDKRAGCWAKKGGGGWLRGASVY